ncbi:DUF2470 domain-containing protein [Jiella sp. MQZ9-1]|uniref:HugZ family protein n=1 Tax=Jiella flava TaxID=2816857 RepID=A0A939JVA7_9HYPH|nr:DUF2470 domain-containing protein [Jiella flava]MBO0664010.1 HugZ family protein [Jiella flava]MCD2472581.1 DUF2470 domain-containing protein [Jiella flava]
MIDDPGDIAGQAGASSGTGADGPKPPSLLQPVDDDARRLARRLIRTARDGALGVLRPFDGMPAVSRALVATDFAGQPIILVSGLSLHAKALAADPRCSVLVGDSGKGDPLAHPRMTIFAAASPLSREDPATAPIRARFLARHPKAELYVDFPDFRFLALAPTGASLNGGFAKAFELQPDDLVDTVDANLPALALRARDHMNADHGDAVDLMAAMAGESGAGWRIATVDRHGFEVARGSRLIRIEFALDPADVGYRDAFVALLRTKPDGS